MSKYPYSRSPFARFAKWTATPPATRWPSSWPYC